MKTEMNLTDAMSKQKIMTDTHPQNNLSPKATHNSNFDSLQKKVTT